jgi:hypothetical protein
MKIDLDVIEPAESLTITLDGKDHEFDLLDILFSVRAQMGDKDVPDDPNELVQVFKDAIDLKLTTLHALVVFRTITESGQLKVDNLLKNALGTSQQSITTSESDSKPSEGSTQSNSQD